MNDDEMFIREIVDHPGEAMPRLVYADWLDERDDPRGAYLRAEQQWAGAKRVPRRLAELAEVLDPVWVARVSRPPLGICSEHLKRSSDPCTTTVADLDDIAHRLDVEIPPQIQAILLNYSLGFLKAGPFHIPPLEGPETTIDAFVCLNDPDYTDGYVSYEIDDWTEWWREEYGLPEQFVPLASTISDDVDYFVSCDESDPGAVYMASGYEMYDDPEEGMTRLADSVGMFLTMLRPAQWQLQDEEEA